MPIYKSDEWASTIDLVNSIKRTSGSGGGGSLNALYVSTATTYSSGATGTLWVDVNGNLKTTLATKIAGEDLTNDLLKVEQQGTRTSLTSLTTVLAKSGAGFFYGFNVGMPSCPTINLWDGLTPGTGQLITKLAAGYPMGSHPLNISLATGLTVDATAAGVVPSIVFSTR